MPVFLTPDEELNTPKTCNQNYTDFENCYIYEEIQLKVCIYAARS